MGWVVLVVIQWHNICSMTTKNRAMACLGCHTTYVYTHDVFFCCHVCSSISHDIAIAIAAMWHQNMTWHCQIHAAALQWIYVISSVFFQHLFSKFHVSSVIACDTCFRLSCKPKYLHDKLISHFTIPGDFGCHVIYFESHDNLNHM